ncbi:MFS transporter [Kineococcus rhizosphaerae]|uniref:MFS transporter n=1 Tax=Kineococcus rhizosphaerae TaxID=559628 RepID=A0A2T0R2B3_9ACTN|nr:MFS transporter [Kineococcus rhizosphaerae]PRY13948.1 MFS transporter [Kineococcus rhizosphaerae]
MPEHHPTAASAATAAPAAPGAPVAQVLAADVVEAGADSGPMRSPVKAGYIILLLVTMFGAYVALVAPIGLSLSLRVQQLAPSNVEVLGYIIGAGALVNTVTGPLIGLWSDRTRSRFGRRRLFSLGGALLGILGLVVIATAGAIPLVFVGWILASFGWTTVMNSLLYSQADRLPESQYGKVAGFSGFVQMVAPVAGVGLASAFLGNNYLVFLVPGALGLLTALAWFAFSREQDTRTVDLPQPLTPLALVRSLVFDPRRYPDFAWNWLARLLFMTGVTFSSTFTSLFFAARLTPSGQVADLGSILVIASMVSLVTTGIGALGCGFVSDKLGRRRIFVLGSGVLYTLGAIILAFGGHSFNVLMVGSGIMGLALGIFSAVDQALVLNVLPEKDTDAGRFLGINGYTTSIAQAVAPLLAAPLLLIGVSAGQKNYALLFMVAAGCTLIAGFLVQAKVRAVR